MRIITHIIAMNAHIPLLETREYDECIIGYCRKSNRFIYSVAKMIQRLKEKMNHEEAYKYFRSQFEENNDNAIWCYDYFGE